jgi:hypothetical protein
MHTPLLADGIWPSAMAEMGLLSPIPILIGLLIEWVVLHYAFNLSWKKAAWIDLAMNVASAALGYVFIPSAGLLWGFGLDLYLWYLIAVLLSTATEASVVKWLFKIPLHRRGLWILFGANGLSAGIALVMQIVRLRL